MSSDPLNAGPSPAPEASRAELVRSRGAALLDGLEKHVPGSREHAEASGSYAFATAVELGLGRSEAELCREIAKLHDIGQMYVPSEVLSKPSGTLTAAEREQLDSHFEAGAHLALGAGLPDDVCAGLQQQRERYDRRGPDGLARDDIPIAARITRAACLCDRILARADSALGSGERRVRNAIDELRGAAGRELDPVVVEALAAVLSRSGA